MYKENKTPLSDTNINTRLDIIKGLSNNIKPMIRFDDYGKEEFLLSKCICTRKHTAPTDKCYDIRCILHKKLMDIKQVVDSTQCKMVYLKSGATGHTFMGVSTLDKNIKYAIKVVAFQKKEKYGNVNDVRRPENAELLMIKVLSYFVINNHTPHIVLPIATFNTSVTPFIEMHTNKLVSHKKYNSFVRKCNEGDYYEYVSILLSEWANGGDLLDYIRKHYKSLTTMHWRVIFFQIISALSVIQEKYPAFRHNDLKANNILVHNITLQPELKELATDYKYCINGVKFTIPNMGFHLKIWDFDFASIDGLVDNTKVCAQWTDDINVSPVTNRYYDIHYFLNTLIRKEFCDFFFDKDAVPEEVKEFIFRIVPFKYREDINTNILLKWLKDVVPTHLKELDKIQETKDKRTRYTYVKEFIKTIIPTPSIIGKEFTHFKDYLKKLIPEKNNSDKEYALLGEFIDRIGTTNYSSAPPFKYVTDKGRILVNDELTTPFKIITTDPFFASFLKKK